MSDEIKTLTDLIAKTISLEFYENRNDKSKINYYDLARRIVNDMEKHGIKIPWEGTYKDGCFYIKQLNGTYYSPNTLKTVDKDYFINPSTPPQPGKGEK